MSALEPFEIDPREIDPRPCELCGLTIDQHQMVDTGEGSEFFCNELSSDAADIVQRWEEADPRDRWKHTGEPRPTTSRDRIARPGGYRTAQATVDAFWHVVGLGDTERLSQWLAQHPMDASHLHEIWGRKCSTAAA
jgi:hypothetical protein